MQSRLVRYLPLADTISRTGDATRLRLRSREYVISIETTFKAHISRRLTYFGTSSTRLRALIGLDLLIVVHLIV